MKTKKYYAIEATIDKNKKLLCWKDGKHFYFAETKKGYSKPIPPTLFNTKKEAQKALKDIPKSKGDLSQFEKVIEANSVNIVPVELTF